MKDKVFYVALAGISVAIIAFGVCFGMGLTDYVGLVACCIAFVGLLYAFFQDKRHEKMAKERENKEQEEVKEEPSQESANLEDGVVDGESEGKNE